MPSYKDFDPADAAALASEMEGAVRGVAADWWKTNHTLVAGYLKALAEATLQTGTARAEGRISEMAAASIIHTHEVAFTDVVRFSKFMTLVLAQNINEAVFRVVGWVIYNRTGLNLFPQLVDPSKD